MKTRTGVWLMSSLSPTSGQLMDNTIASSPAPGFSGRRPVLGGLVAGEAAQVVGPGTQGDSGQRDLGRCRDRAGDARPAQAVQQGATGERCLGELPRPDPAAYHRRRRWGGSSARMMGMAASIAAAKNGPKGLMCSMSALLVASATAPGECRLSPGPLIRGIQSSTP